MMSSTTDSSSSPAATVGTSPSLTAWQLRLWETGQEHGAAIDAWAAVMRQHQRFQVITHSRPDGDALGSALAVHHLLLHLGKMSRVFTGGPIGENFDFLPGIGNVAVTFDEAYNPEVTIYIDCGHWNRADERDLRKGLVVDVDHHIGNPMFGSINYVDSLAAAAGEQVFALVDRCGFELTPEVALCIHVAVVSDTGNFRYGNTAAHIFEIATRCTMAGVRPAEVASLLFERKRPASVMMSARIMSRLKLEFDGRMAWAEARKEDYADLGGDAAEPEGVVGDLRAIAGVDLAILIHETPEGQLRASFRSRNGFNCQTIAASLGGGGHQQASGVMMRESYESARDRLLGAARAAMA